MNEPSSGERIQDIIDSLDEALPAASAFLRGFGETHSGRLVGALLSRGWKIVAAVDRPSRTAGSEEAHLYELLKKARGAVTAIVSIASLTETLDADRGYWERVEEEINAALRRAGDVRHEPERKGP